MNKQSESDDLPPASEGSKEVGIGGRKGGVVCEDHNWRSLEDPCPECQSEIARRLDEAEAGSTSATAQLLGLPLFEPMETLEEQGLLPMPKIYGPTREELEREAWIRFASKAPTDLMGWPYELPPRAPQMVRQALASHPAKGVSLFKLAFAQLCNPTGYAPDRDGFLALPFEEQVAMTAAEVKSQIADALLVQARARFSFEPKGESQDVEDHEEGHEEDGQPVQARQEDRHQEGGYVGEGGVE